MHSKGYGVVYALLMSVFIYAGSMQFIAVSLLSTGASLSSGAMMTLLINARHMVYGLSMIQKYTLFFISFLNQCYSVIGSVLGSLIGSLLVMNTTGLDFAMTALLGICYEVVFV